MTREEFAPIVERVRTALAETPLIDLDIDVLSGTYTRPEDDGPETRLTIWRASFLASPERITCCADCFIKDPWRPRCDHGAVWQ